MDQRPAFTVSVTPDLGVSSRSQHSDCRQRSASTRDSAKLEQTKLVKCPTDTYDPEHHEWTC